MTQTTVRCTECDSFVELIRRENRQLALVCDCAYNRPIKVSGMIPEVWQ